MCVSALSKGWEVNHGPKLALILIEFTKIIINEIIINKYNKKRKPGHLKYVRQLNLSTTGSEF